MADYRAMTVVLAAVLLLALGGIALVTFSPSYTGGVSAYQQVHGFGSIENAPDPHTQYIAFDEGVCSLVQQRPVTFRTWVDRQCETLNPGRQKRKGDCAYQAMLQGATICRAAPVFGNILPPQYLTGKVAANPLECAGLADQYDGVLQQTFDRAETPGQTVALINPCSGAEETAIRQTYSPESPLREYSRAAFDSGDIAGSITGDENGQGEVIYVRCVTGTARVTVSGTPMCNSMG